MRRLHPGKQFEFVALDAAESSWPLDPVDFAELLSILLDNAGKWSRRNIVVELTGNAETLQLRIVDDGPGLAPENTVTAFEIGTRFDPSKPGSGLGLAIAHDIAQAMLYERGMDMTPHMLALCSHLHTGGRPPMTML